ncbi:3-methyladenine DNA glycosylase [Candidatus Nitrosocosmicus franklandus]|uniref:DNA alkylation repair enzyme n=1 Tax=Candidatus Nitrosocosmicus franklandianus TaxID=1798806 RepID=A0A484IB11_9ARCH|nr:3-methyladenine DNA glycosylase [Candidatus Nitrosocosmicus franklandus]VFJ14952.1 DNA alkylation repair enzyme [Candidatus Nitrosocosmicus franklandus]
MVGDLRKDNKSTKLKDFYGKELAILLAGKISKVYPSFQRQDFINSVDKRVNDLELKDRIKLITENLYEYLPLRYPDVVNILINILGPPNPNETGMFREGYWIMPISFYVETYGLDNFETSTNAIYQITQRSTGEYAVRPFIVKYSNKMLALMLKWSCDSNVHVRRLSSEGLRPRLPWAKKLDQFILDPKPILPILENLKYDKSLFVKKSVANNINDILKDNYDIGIKLLKKWSESQDVNTQWIIKHSLRNELKRGNKEAMEIVKTITKA